jgi:hypothetical protein
MDRHESREEHFVMDAAATRTDNSGHWDAANLADVRAANSHNHSQWGAPAFPGLTQAFAQWQTSNGQQSKH